MYCGRYCARARATRRSMAAWRDFSVQLVFAGEPQRTVAAHATAVSHCYALDRASGRLVSDGVRIRFNFAPEPRQPAAVAVSYRGARVIGIDCSTGAAGALRWSIAPEAGTGHITCSRLYLLALMAAIAESTKERVDAMSEVVE